MAPPNILKQSPKKDVVVSLNRETPIQGPEGCDPCGGPQKGTPKFGKSHVAGTIHPKQQALCLRGVHGTHIYKVKGL